MRARNKLNVKQIASLNAPGVYSDGGGLYLRVRPTGSKSWLYVSTVGGERREYGLGSAADVPLSKARDKAGTLRAAFCDGQIPLGERESRKKIATTPAIFGTFADDLIDDIEGGFRNEKHKAQWRSTIKTYAASLLDRGLETIVTEDILELLKPIWLEKPETARRVRGRIERILDAARVRGLRAGENPARWRGHLELLLPRQKKKDTEHHAALPYKELPAFMANLRARPATAARALEFAILTAARTGEVLGATWSEVDLQARVWTVPSDRMKAGEAHEVPLSNRAVKLLKSMKPAGASSDRRVFSTPSGGALSNMAMLQLLKRMNFQHVTVHGFRSTFRDWAGDETQHAREDIEMALAHKIGNDVEESYRRSRALGKRRKLMTAWDAFCGSRATAK